MRISNNMLTNNYLYSLNKSLERQADIQEKLADGKAIHRPSDNPIKSIRALRFNTNLDVNEQYTQNLKDALSWMETTDGALQDMSKITIQAKELAIKAISVNPTEGFQAIAKEIDGLVSQLVQAGNVKIGDRYIFSGQQDKKEPFEAIKDASGSIIRVEYRGDGNKISMPIQPGLTDPAKDGINLVGTEVFGATVYIDPANPGANPSPTPTGTATDPTVTLFNNLIALRDELMKPSPNLQDLSNKTLQKLDDDRDSMLRAHTHLGARMATYEMSKNLMENQNNIITGDVAANEDLDIPKAVIDAKNSENVYKMALAVGARIMPPSLVDFLR